MGEEALPDHVFAVRPRDGVEGRDTGEGDEPLIAVEAVHGSVQCGLHPGELGVRGTRPGGGQGPEEDQRQPKTEQEAAR